jgi:hypothetical protein
MWESWRSESPELSWPTQWDHVEVRLPELFSTYLFLLNVRILAQWVAGALLADARRPRRGEARGTCQPGRGNTPARAWDRSTPDQGATVIFPRLSKKLVQQCWYLAIFCSSSDFMWSKNRIVNQCPESTEFCFKLIQRCGMFYELVPFLS